MTASRADLDPSLEEFLAELTVTAYRVSLRYGVKGSSIDLELDLWRELREVLRQQSRSGPDRNILPEPTPLTEVVA